MHYSGSSFEKKLSDRSINTNSIIDFVARYQQEFITCGYWWQ